MLRRSVAPLVAAALTAVLGAAARLDACSCTNQHTLQEEVAAANTVFFGHVTDIQLAGDGLNVLVTMTPLLRWKGGLDATVTVLTGMNEGVCGVPFQVGLDYVVFSWNQVFSGRPVQFTHLCTYDSQTDAAHAVQVLGPALVPTPAHVRSWGGVKRAWR